MIFYPKKTPLIIWFTVKFSRSRRHSRYVLFLHSSEKHSKLPYFSILNHRIKWLSSLSFCNSEYDAHFRMLKRRISCVISVF